jgi:hypothetical protein
MNRCRWNIKRIRQRHVGYRYVLGLMVVLLLAQPLAQAIPLLNCSLVIGLATFLMVALTRVSPLLNSRIPTYCLGCLAIGLEIIYAVMIKQAIGPGFAFTFAHVVAWIAFFGLYLFRMVRALVREPSVTTSVVMGAASFVSDCRQSAFQTCDTSSGWPRRRHQFLSPPRPLPRPEGSMKIDSKARQPAG